MEAYTNHIPECRKWGDVAISKARDCDVAESVDRLDCVICLENERNVLVHSCNHLCMCTSCAEKETECPICRPPMLEMGLHEFLFREEQKRDPF